MKKDENYSPAGTNPLPGGQNNSGNDDASAVLSDEVLVNNCRSGNLAAFAPLMERYQQRLFNAVLRMLGNYDDAQEIAQETFFRAFQGLRKFRGNARFYTWLFRIGMNLCINHHQHRRLRFASLSTDPDLPGQAVGLAALADPASPSPLRQAQINEEHRLVLTALDKLEPHARAVVVLRDVEQLDYEQIARILEIPAGTVKSRLFRARLALRDQLLGPNADHPNPNP